MSTLRAKVTMLIAYISLGVAIVCAVLIVAEINRILKNYF